ncbi:MAG TPA: ATP-binding protein [Verrucomicrobiae bacterium]|nr:ATP-binding protein [Verrucomicrobiae bacterium]
MTIRARLTIWYAGVLTVSLLLISGGAFQEIYEQLRHQHRPRSERRALSEAGELVLETGLPAVLLGLAGGWWLTRRALSPLSELSHAARLIDESNLSQPLPRSGNGDELDRLTEVLNQMKVRLQESFTGIREFTLDASHELKTPLAIMHGELETALRDETLAASGREFLLNQLGEVRRLSKVVDALTLLTRADAGQVRLNRETLALDDLVRDAHADALILAEPAGVEVGLETCEAVSLAGDRHRLRQLLLNLTDNAVKYNQPGGSIKMSLRMIDGHAEFTISNSGPGIPPESLPRVFDRFFRSDRSHSSAVEGCGLGLSIARWIVSAHHGTITIESVPQAWTTVKVQLPLAPAEKTA